MSDKSAIEWTDATWNPVRGCEKVSPGCAHCYAETFAERFRSVPGHPYEQGFDLRLVPEKLTEPLMWRKPRRVFVNSMSDLFQDGVPDSYIDQVFAVMALSPAHTFQVLTKRAERMHQYLTATVDGWGRAARIAEAAQALCGFDGAKYNVHRAARRSPNSLVLPDGNVFWLGSCNPPDQPYRERWILKTWPLLNVWLGPSVENQPMADRRFPDACELGEAGWRVMVSMEPLLSAVNVPARFLALGPRAWVIVGGESGHGARPFDVAWARSIVQQCREAGVPCFVKQLGRRVCTSGEPRGWDYAGDGIIMLIQGDAHLKSKKGGDPSEWPDDLRVREFPS